MDRVEQVMLERQPRADLGNGYFCNPILAGDYADPSLVRVDQDYYMTHSYWGAPSVLIWHSRDLVNWRPLGKVLTHHLGDVWAPELVFYKERFYLYLPIVSHEGSKRRFSTVVLTAQDVAGPWSEPMDLGLAACIDPGHVADEKGNRYLFVNKGRALPLCPDGLSTAGKLEQVYDGWQYPPDWFVECFCLESPKFVKRGEYYYQISAQGGTSGPATSHMIITARARHPMGPWENDPRNPMLRTWSRRERWWSQGHGTLFEDHEANWWLVYHAFEHGYRPLGRQTLLLPVTWTEDDWPRLMQQASDILQKPAGENVGHGLPLSDDFSGEALGLQWRHFETQDPKDSYLLKDRQLIMQAKGSSFSTGSYLACLPVNKAYEVQLEVQIRGRLEAGLMLLNGNFLGETTPQHHGCGFREHETFTYWRSKEHAKAAFDGDTIHFKFLNIHYDAKAFYSSDGHDWQLFDRGLELSDSFGRQFLGLYAFGEGQAYFRHFQYRGLA